MKKKNRGFAPTPTLASFHFWKIFVIYSIVSSDEQVSVKYYGETKKSRQSWCGGFGLIEMLVGAAVLSSSLLGISTFFQASLQVSGTTESAIQGDYLLEEGVEGVKLLRDASYTNNIQTLSTTTPYYLLWNSSSWIATTTSALIDNTFERKFSIADVKRDANDDIASTGTIDPKTKLVTVSVAWSSKGATTTRSIGTYLTNLFNN
jgi:Tfp pilus assembly protein PilV